MAQRSVLIVENDPEVSGMLALLFRLEGYRVGMAADGLSALYFMASEEAPDLILLDIHLDGLDGPDFAAELKNQERQIPIVVITADPEPAKRAEEVGAAAYVAKPIDVPTLLAAVDRITEAAA